MLNISAWEIYGIVLISLYFVLSLFRPKPAKRAKQEESKTSEAEQRPDLHTGLCADSGKLGLKSEASRKKDFIHEEIASGTNCQATSSQWSTSEANADLISEPTSKELSVVAGEESKLRRRFQPEDSPQNAPDSTTNFPEYSLKEKITTSGNSSEFRGTFPTTDGNLKNLAEVESKMTIVEVVSSLKTPEEHKKEVYLGIDVEKGKEECFFHPVQYEENKSNVQASSHSLVECADSDGGVRIDQAQRDGSTTVSDFADDLVHSTTTVATEVLQSRVSYEIPNKFAEDFSCQVLEEAMSQLKEPEFQQSSLPNSLRERQLEQFVDDLVSIAIDDAVDDAVDDIVQIKTFADDISEIICTEYTQSVISEVRAIERQKKNELLRQYDALGDSVASEIVEEAIEEAAQHKSDDSSSPENASFVEEHTGIIVCDSEKLDFSGSCNIQPCVGVVVENVVNSAICEAASRIKRENGFEEVHGKTLPDVSKELASDSLVNEGRGDITVAAKKSNKEDMVMGSFEESVKETLESQVSESLENIVISAVDEASEAPASENVEKINEDKISDTVELGTRVTVDDEEKDEKDDGLKIKDDSVKIIEDKVTNDIEYAENSLENLHDFPKIPDITVTLDGECVVKTESSSDAESHVINDDTGPPSHQKVEHANVIQLRDKKEKSDKSSGSFWRSSLILDLEEEVDFEESFDSGPSDISSPEDCKQIDFPTKMGEEDPHVLEDSDEFSDSEEDEIIDHAAEAQLGAVGGSNASKELNNVVDLHDEVNDEDDEYDYIDDNDEEDDNNDQIFEPYMTVDGLCVSKPKEKGRLKSVESTYNRAVVLDNGSGVIKLGFAGDRVPRVIQPAAVGMPQRYSMHITGLDANVKDYKKYGDAAVAKSGIMQLRYPMSAGLIDSWPDIMELWECMMYDELGIVEGANPVIVTEVAENHKKNREKTAQILFEQFSVPAMYMIDQLALSLYAAGMTSGVCLSSGFSCTQAAVVYEGHTLGYTLQQLDIGGKQLTENLRMLLRDVRGKNFTSSSGWQIVNDMKEKMGFISKDFVNEVDMYKKSDALTEYYKLPDGQLIGVGYERMSCVEPLFRPDTLLAANDTIASQPPVHKLISKAIKRCDPDLQDMCRHHITVSGGTTTAQGFTSRLQSELQRVDPKLKKLRLPEHRKLSPWIGGSILGTLSTLNNMYITVDEYADSGPRIVHKKCF